MSNMSNIYCHWKRESHHTILSSVPFTTMPISSGKTRIILQLWMIYRSCKIGLQKLSPICLAMLHPLMISKHSTGQPCSKGALYIDIFRYIPTFKYIHGLVDYNFNILRSSDFHGYNTRRKNDFRLPLVKRNYGKQRLLYKCVKEWNLLDMSFKEIDSFLVFNQSVKNYVFSYSQRGSRMNAQLQIFID